MSWVLTLGLVFEKNVLHPFSGCMPLLITKVEETQSFHQPIRIPLPTNGPDFSLVSLTILLQSLGEQPVNSSWQILEGEDLRHSNFQVNCVQKQQGGKEMQMVLNFWSVKLCWQISCESTDSHYLLLHPRLLINLLHVVMSFTCGLKI